MGEMSNTPSKANDRIESIQALRGFAALIVVIHHAIKLMDYRPDIKAGIIWSSPGLHDFGAIGVDIFFVISGFAMAEAVSGARSKAASRFLAERFVRVMPLFWLMSLLAALVLMVMGWDFSSGQIANSVTLLPLWDGVTFHAPILSVGWTLMFEWAFYLVVAIALMLRPQRPLPIVLGATFGLGMLGMLLGTLPAMPMLWLNAMWLEFAGGVLLQMLWRSGAVSPKGWVGPAMLAGGLLGFAATIWSGPAFSVQPEDLFRNHDHARFLTWGLPSILFVGGTLLVAERAMIKARLERARWWLASLKLGDMSYSLYLVHLLPFIVLTEQLPGFPWRGEWLVLAMTLGSVVAAALLYRFAELPMLRLGRNWLLNDRRHGTPSIITS
jgi:exopolysaccharide production protein ExoZ